MTETLPAAQEWSQYSGELRHTIVSALATKGSPLSAGDLVEGSPPLPLIGLFTEAQGEASRYHQLYPDKKLSAIEVMASIRNFSDQARAAELAGQNALDFHYVDGSSEKLTPRAANARLLGFTIYALDRQLIAPEMIADLLKNDDPLEFWTEKIKDHPIDGNKMLEEIIIKNPHHPFNQQARQLIPNADSPDIFIENNPVMKTVLDAHKMHLRLQQARPHGTTKQDLLTTHIATNELFSMHQLPPDQSVQITTLAFLGKKTIDDDEFRALSTAIAKYMYETMNPALISPSAIHKYRHETINPALQNIDKPANEAIEITSGLPSILSNMRGSLELSGEPSNQSNNEREIPINSGDVAVEGELTRTIGLIEVGISPIFLTIPGQVVLQHLLETLRTGSFQPDALGISASILLVFGFVSTVKDGLKRISRGNILSRAAAIVKSSNRPGRLTMYSPVK